VHEDGDRPAVSAAEGIDMTSAWVFCRGGPKEGQILAGVLHDRLILFDGSSPWAYYKLTAEMMDTDRGSFPVADYVGEQPPAKRPPA
jgi:hypothetical protein